MSNPVVELVREEMILFDQVLLEHPDLFPDHDTLYPIPFFGDIRRAEVVTVALNPSHYECTEQRFWPRRMQAAALTPEMLASRLLHYFDLPVPAPYNWFEEKLGPILHPIHRAHGRNAAHVDLLPFPTLMPAAMTPDQRSEFCGLLSQYGNRLSRVLALASRAKVILVSDWTINNGAGGHISLWETFKQHCGPMLNLIVPDGSSPPVLRNPMVYGQRYEIRERLISGPLLNP